MARRGDAADRDGDGDGPADVATVSVRRSPTAGRRRSQIFRRADLQDHAELVAGEHAKLIAAAQLGADPLGDLRDRLVGHRKAVGFVRWARLSTATEESALGAKPHRLSSVAASVSTSRCDYLAAHRIEIGEAFELSFALVPLGNDPHHALARAGSPSAPLNQRPVSSSQILSAPPAGRSAYCT